MKKTILFSIAVVALGAAAVFANCGKCAGDKKAEPVKAAEVKAAKSDCANCPMHKQAAAKKCTGKMCPEKIAGVETSSKNIPEGVEITMTAKDKATVAQLQELAVVHYSNTETMDPACPGRVAGAQSRLENTADGARVQITGKTPEIIKKIQEASAKEHQKAAAPAKKLAKAPMKYACSMGCAEAAKPGKCPKCGMEMTEKK